MYDMPSGYVPKEQTPMRIYFPEKTDFKVSSRVQRAANDDDGLVKKLEEPRK